MAATVSWNPFQNEPLRLPADYEWLKDLTKAGGGDAERKRLAQDELAPFNRMVDAWLLCIALGARHRDDPIVFDPPAHRFEYGSRLAHEENAINFLHHVALAELLRNAKTDEEQEAAAYTVIDEPSQVVAICNDLAARGMPLLREMVESATIPVLAELIRGMSSELKS